MATGRRRDAACGHAGAREAERDAGARRDLAQFGWFEASYNDLIDPDAADPISGTVALRSHLCEVLKDGGIPAR